MKGSITVIATHNIKVNGVWVSAGESYGATEQPVQMKVDIPQEPEKEPEKSPETETEAQEKPEKKTRGGRRKANQ